MVQALLIICNLFLLESMLSVDNAAALAVIVADLPQNQQRKGLTYGLLGAFVFRGLSLFFVSFLIHLVWLKVFGGAYLLWMSYAYFNKSITSAEELGSTEPENVKHKNKLYGKFVKTLGPLWATIVIVEIMDMAFSIDNIFAAVALTSKIMLILIGVFMGMIAMRFVANWFVRLMAKHPSLERSSYIVIGLLGLRLVVEFAANWVPAIGNFMHTNLFSYIFSGCMLAVFFYPLITPDQESLENLIADEIH